MEYAEDEQASASDSENGQDTTSIAELSAREKQNQYFKNLVSKAAKDLTDKESKLGNLNRELTGLEGSTLHLLTRQDFAATIDDPREYQVELFEKAKKENTIAVLATGSGKTLIAILLLKHVIQHELIGRDEGRRPRISFFLVDSVTLVFQQSAVLRNNIDQPISSLFGGMAVDLWSKEAWSQAFKDNMIIVCTADILHQCLLNGFINMEDINLLVFDEAHHAKKGHAYARIMKDCYIKADLSSRPHIFGMTASPLDAKGDPVKAANDLEAILHSKIATTSNLALLQQIVSSPKEEQWKYTAPKVCFKTAFYKAIEKDYGDMECLSKIFAFSLEATSTLGPWCADRVWVSALAAESLPRLRGEIVKCFKRLPSETASKKQDSEMERLSRLSEFVTSHKVSNGVDLEQLSDKVQCLHKKLLELFEKAPDTKCIVFTRQRRTAIILREVFVEFPIPNIRSESLIGVRSGDYAGMSASYHQQIKTTIEFRKGKLNCLFATSVAEEGLDIPDCNLVVRFDLYDTLIQFIQSRGRARHADSIYAHMVEIGNLEHEAKLDQVHQAEDVMTRFCRALPEDRLLDSHADLWIGLLEKESMKREYKIEETGATLTYHFAITVLDRYASSLQYESNGEYSKAHYVITPSKGMYECEVILPATSPIRGLIGRAASRKSLAKESAAFDTCLLLLKRGLIDNRFNSTFHRRLPAMRNAKLSLKSKKTTQYSMIIKPAFWKMGCGFVPNRLYLTVIMFVPGAQLEREHRSILLGTRNSLPQFPEFPIYLEDDIETTVRTIPLTKMLELQSEKLELVTQFTLRVFQDLYNKVYEKDEENMPYWLFPTATHVGEFWDDINPYDAIDWNALRFVSQHKVLDRKSAPSEEIVGRFVYDQWNGKYRYFVTGINKSLRPSDPPPEYLPRRRNMSNILEYGLSLYKKAYAVFLTKCDWEQCVFDAEMLPLRRNFLDKLSGIEKKVERRVVLCLETHTISAIPASIVTSCFAFPAIITRLESYLIARECIGSLNLEIPLAYALQALTKDSDNTDEDRLEQINFQRGMGKNYERLEFLGDCFLKMATSIALFAQNPNDDEYDFHVSRMTLICNRNLFNTAKERKLYQFVRTKGFSRRNWYPEGLKLLRGKGREDKAADKMQVLGEKTIADVCEALIGASLLSGGPVNRFDMAVRAVTALVDSDNHKADSWADYFLLYSLPSYQVKEADGFEKDLANRVEKKLGYRFKYPRLLRSAFTHSSYPSAWATVPCYQRLEFLGDSLLDMVCVEDLFDRFPDRDPQWLTEHKMAMVCNKFLGSLAVRLDLHTHLQYFSSALQGQIARFAEDTQLLYDNNQSVDFWLDNDDPPKCLSDMVEAYMGAIFVDSRFDFGVIERFYAEHIKPYFADMAVYDTFANKHPTTYLHQKLTDDFGCIDYILRAAEIPNIGGAPTKVLAVVLVHDVVLAQETASSGRYAKIKTSQLALKSLEGMTVGQFRENYHCQCSRGSTMLEKDGIGCAI